MKKHTLNLTKIGAWAAIVCALPILFYYGRHALAAWDSPDRLDVLCSQTSAGFSNSIASDYAIKQITLETRESVVKLAGDVAEIKVKIDQLQKIKVADVPYLRGSATNYAGVKP